MLPDLVVCKEACQFCMILHGACVWSRWMQCGPKGGWEEEDGALDLKCLSSDLRVGPLVPCFVSLPA